MMGEICTDNRFKIIAEYKQKLVDGTNIETRPEEMAVIDNILFRFWQMGWLNPNKTNADCIRAMSEKELSYLIADNVDCNSRCKAWKEGCEYSDSTCRQAWLNWLKEEVEDG